MHLLRHFTLLQRLAILIGIFVTAFGACSWWFVSTLSELEVNGPLYRRIVQGKDLVSEILPPPQYIIEAYLVTEQLADADPANHAALITRLRQLRDEYQQHHEFWRRQPLSAEIRQGLELAHQPAEAFFSTALGEFIPALQWVDAATTQAALRRLRDLYAQHRHQIDLLVQRAQYETAIDDAAVEHRIRQAGIGLLACLLLALGATILCAVWIVRSIIGPLQIAAAAAAQLTTGAADTIAAVNAIAAGNLDQDLQPVSWPQIDEDRISGDKMGELLRSVLHLGRIQTALDQALRTMQSALRAARARDHALLAKTEEQAQTLRRQQAALEHSNRAKTTFLSNMSHELRTPLNSVIGFSRLLSASSNLNHDQRRNLDIINRSGNHLLTLINNVLELARIESGRTQIHVEDTYLPGLLQELVDMLRERAEQAGLTLTLKQHQLPGMVRVDAVKLRQVLLNLLANSIKFTRAGSVTLVVEGQPAQIGHFQVSFAVVDTGIGIAPQDQQRIFEPFTQLNDAASGSGTGLGLAISREYLHLLGADLRLESSPGVGTTCRFELLLAGADGPVMLAEAQMVKVVNPQHGRRILVADDNADARLLVRNLLEPLGFSVAEAADCATAVAQAQAFQPDLILMDWRMPDHDGLSATCQIRALALPNRPIIVMLTATAMEEDRRSALAAGVDEFLRKPLEEAKLYQVLEHHLQVSFISVAAPVLAETPLDSADFSGLPAEAMQALRDAVRELNPDKLASAIQLTARTNPGLAAAIQSLVDALNYQQLRQLLGI